MLVDTSELQIMMTREDLVVVDCRFSLPGPGFDPLAGRQDYLRSHIPGAVFLDLEQDLSGAAGATTGRHPLPKFEDFRAGLESVGITPDKTVVAYDDSGNMLAARFWWMLKYWLGHEGVALLDGSFSAWKKADLPLESGEPKNLPGVYAARENTAHLVTMKQVKAIVAGERTGLLLDARAADRFMGQNETVDPIAGHIAGAENLPTALNLDAQKKFLPAAQLRARFAPVVDRAQGCENVVHYCGSGVTACHNLFAMELADFSGARLYPGSWSEWIRYPENLSPAD